ncbi:MAG: hypothetical protein NTX79_01525 [Candidatus Micrarchaeota archaeon]|nr:hypothetical protein [Candidatus Micrarchaeota archaeon]
MQEFSNAPKRSNAADMRPGAQRTMKAVQTELVFNKGHITPKIGTRARNEFEKRIVCSFDPVKLCNSIRDNMGYTIESLASDMHSPEQAQEYLMVENTMNILLDSYDGATRENGRLLVTHPLLVANMAAEIGAPVRTVNTAGFHDINEDVLDPKYPEIKFRATIGGQKAEYETERKIFEYIGRNYGRYGKGLVRDIRHLTRYVTEEEGKSWQRTYQEYLVGVYQFIDAAFAKALDGKANLIDRREIINKEDMARKYGRLLLKVSWQIPRWQRISWIVADLLKSNLDKYPGGKQIADALNGVTEWDMKKFERGWTWNPARQYHAKLFHSVSRSGSPIIDIYPASDVHKNMYEIELPFFKYENEMHVRIAHEIIKCAFGRKVGKIRRASSILPERLTSSVIFLVESDAGDFWAGMPRAVEIMDGAFASGLLLPQLAGFNRAEYTDAARERMERIRRERGSLMAGKPLIG